MWQTCDVTRRHHLRTSCKQFSHSCRRHPHSPPIKPGCGNWDCWWNWKSCSLYTLLFILNFTWINHSTASMRKASLSAGQVWSEAPATVLYLYCTLWNLRRNAVKVVQVVVDACWLANWCIAGPIGQLSFFLSCHISSCRISWVCPWSAYQLFMGSSHMNALHTKECNISFSHYSSAVWTTTVQGNEIKIKSVWFIDSKSTTYSNQ